MIPIGNTKAETIFKKSDTPKDKLVKSLNTKKRATTLYKTTGVQLVPPRGIEPRSTV
jgi:hypothetical protein